MMSFTYFIAWSIGKQACSVKSNIAAGDLPSGRFPEALFHAITSGMHGMNFKENHPLRLCTTIGTGGPARLYGHAQGPEQLRGMIALAADRGLPVCVLGRGSNVLAADEGFAGLVVVLGGQFRDIRFDYGQSTITAGAGASLIRLGVAIARQGFAGCAYMGVIPGSVGGAVRMNAGTGQGQEIACHLARVRVLDPATLQERWLDAGKLELSYRSSMLSRTRQMVLEAAFRLPARCEATQCQPLADIKELFARRRQAQPRSRHTFGSVFKNPAGAEHSAGWYLERVGMKGMRSGTAMVSQEHANWIVNTGGARSQDVKALVETGRTRVFDQFGIRLEREVFYLPEDLML
jgi:UDP-N-acetylmuramate dehydrogenase